MPEDISDELGIAISLYVKDYELADLLVRARTEIDRLRARGDALVAALDVDELAVAAVFAYDWKQARNA